MYFQITGTHVRLLGSMHLFPATSRRMPPWIGEAYDWAETLVLESSPPAILPLLRSSPHAGAQPDASHLEPLLSSDAWNRLQAAWPVDGPLAPFADLRPWAALIIAPTLFQHVVEGVEPRMLRSAIAQRKPYQFLETAQDVAASLETIPLEAIGAALALLMTDVDEPQRTLESMHGAWLDGDTACVQRIATESPMFNLPGIREAILDARNRAWAARLTALLGRAERTLVVVGALHLSGPGNLIECLGRPVEPVSFGAHP
ncbi:TraB/GumN family protein [Paraburkholderia sp. PREW-6R]|uniref:TraB/GumN family protein n=1 Tax=Paraburkholderia sp. PREW-6R TaxID=3141544 RepID=UPI0031F484E4